MLKKSELYKALAVTAEVTGANPTEAALRVMADRLVPYPAAVVAKALERCQVELRRPLTLGDIFDRLEDGHLGPEEAWAMVARIEEEDTVVWTDQIAVGYGAARGALPDRVAARLAFVEAYRREVAAARQRGQPPVWWPCLGWDVGRRAAPVVDAVALGRLSPKMAQVALPPAEWLPEWASERALPAAPGAEEAVPPDAGRELREIIGMLSKKRATP